MTRYYHSKKNTDRPVFVTTYNPSLPQLNSIIRKYFPILTATKRGSEAFKDAPLIAYRRPKNLRDFLVKAKLKQPSQSNKTQPNIISRCNDGRCRTCKFIAHGTSSYTFYNTGEQRKIPHSLSCSPDNLIYLINCKRCIKKDPTLPCQYIGQTLFLVVMMAAVALANLLLMVLHPIHFTTLENNVKSHIVCPALQTTSYI